MDNLKLRTVKMIDKFLKRIIRSSAYQPFVHFTKLIYYPLASSNALQIIFKSASLVRQLLKAARIPGFPL